MGILASNGRRWALQLSKRKVKILFRIQPDPPGPSCKGGTSLNQVTWSELLRSVLVLISFISLTYAIAGYKTK